MPGYDDTEAGTIYKGSDTDIVNSSYLFTTLQSFYTKIKNLLTGKADSNHTHDYASAHTAIAFGNASTAITTANFVALCKDNGAFSKPYWCARATWVYANNKYISDTECGDIPLAGATVEVMGTEHNYTIRILTSTTSGDHSPNPITSGEFIYVNNGSSYSPGWRRVYSTANKPTLSELGAASSNHSHNYAGSSSNGGAATTALNAAESVFTIPNNGSTNAEGGQLCLKNTNGGYWNIDSCDNNFRIFDNSGKVNLILKENDPSNSTFSGSADKLDGHHASDFLMTSASCNKNWNWSGQNGQPTWVWGGEDGTNMYVYNPSNFNVNKANRLEPTGFGVSELTYHQTPEDFYGNSNWCHYIIANHLDGASYYNYVLGLPFWGTPIYKRQTGDVNSNSGWQKFYTTENITYGTSGMTAGSSSLANGNIYIQYE